MHWTLPSTSAIYQQLKPLTFLNFLVGEDDITADKDFKHIFKRQRNLMLRNKGFLIEGFCITPSILCLHLCSNGVPQHRIWSLLNPNDKQDVVLGYRLLKEIWSLLLAPSLGDPMFLRARKVLGLYGEFARHLINSYICVDLNLDEQLTHLSTAAHLAFYFYTHNSTRMDFMPSQSYIDIMIMIKNTYFCVAKSKVDHPNGKFFLILLGTDKLEGFFGLVRTAVGTDCNADLLQLGSRASGLTEVAVILSLHPEWDRAPRRLNLPAMTMETDELTSKIDHINPASWHGDVHVKNINLQTSWVLGWQKAIELVPNAKQIFEEAAMNDNIDFLSLFGQILVNQCDEDEAYDCSNLLEEYSPSNNLDINKSPATTLHPATSVSHVNTTLDGDLEDAMAHELPRGPISSDVTIGGKKMGKPAALRNRLQHCFNRLSLACWRGALLQFVGQWVFSRWPNHFGERVWFTLYPSRTPCGSTGLLQWEGFPSNCQCHQSQTRGYRHTGTRTQVSWQQNSKGWCSGPPDSSNHRGCWPNRPTWLVLVAGNGNDLQKCPRPLSLHHRHNYVYKTARGNIVPLCFYIVISSCWNSVREPWWLPLDLDAWYCTHYSFFILLYLFPLPSHIESHPSHHIIYF